MKTNISDSKVSLSQVTLLASLWQSLLYSSRAVVRSLRTPMHLMLQTIPMATLLRRGAKALRAVMTQKQRARSLAVTGVTRAVTSVTSKFCGVVPPDTDTAIFCQNFSALRCWTKTICSCAEGNYSSVKCLSHTCKQF